MGSNVKLNPSASVPRRSGCRIGIAAMILTVPWSTAGAERAAADVVKTQCVRCHQAGTANAPKVGDKAAWTPRLQRGIDALLLSAIRGHGGMPPRGGVAELTDMEMRGAILYMFDPAGPPRDLPKGAMAPNPSGAGPSRISAGGMDLYLGRVSAEHLRTFPAGSPETKIHGGIPSGSGYYHVSISAFDSVTQAPVPGAIIELDIEQLGMGRQPARLEPISLAGNACYGGYVRLLPKSSYTFAVRVRKPGGSAPVEATFRERVD